MSWASFLLLVVLLLPAEMPAQPVAFAQLTQEIRPGDAFSFLEQPMPSLSHLIPGRREVTHACRDRTIVSESYVRSELKILAAAVAFYVSLYSPKPWAVVEFHANESEVWVETSFDFNNDGKIDVILHDTQWTLYRICTYSALVR